MNRFQTSLSNFAFKFKLCRYNQAAADVAAAESAIVYAVEYAQAHPTAAPDAAGAPAAAPAADADAAAAAAADADVAPAMEVASAGTCMTPRSAKVRRRRMKLSNPR
jgi:hypothetical protein